MSEDSVLADISINANLQVSINLLSDIKAAKEEKKKNLKELRRNKKKTKTISSDDNKENEVKPVETQNSSTAVPVSKSENDDAVKPVRGLADRSNAGSRGRQKK